MIKLFKLFSRKPVATKVAPICKPIDGRHGHVGGIEAIVLDDVFWFFGFDYGSDLVLSPLMNDIDEAARFASENMLQRDGRHDEAYWREEAGYALEGSQLCSEPEKRIFSSRTLALMADAIRQAQQSNSVVPTLSIEYHLLYLLDSAGGWSVSGTERLETLIATVSGSDPLPEHANVSDYARELQTTLRAILDAAPGNWATLFAPLRP